MKKENINALDEIHKGTCMGMDATKFVLDITEDKDLRDVIKKQYEDYKTIAKEIEEIYPKYNDGKPHETTFMNKMMTWHGIEMETKKDKSSSKIAELLLNGVNMGIIEGRRILNKKKIDKEVNDIVDKYVSMQEVSVEVLKEYL